MLSPLKGPLSQVTKKSKLILVSSRSIIAISSGGKMSFYGRHGLNIYSFLDLAPSGLSFEQRLQEGLKRRSINGTSDVEAISVCNPVNLESPEVHSIENAVHGCIRHDFKKINTKIYNSRLNQLKKEHMKNNPSFKRRKGGGRTKLNKLDPEILEVLKETVLNQLLKETKVNSKFYDFFIKKTSEEKGILYVEHGINGALMAGLAETLDIKVHHLGLQGLIKHDLVASKFLDPTPSCVKINFLNWLTYNSIFIAGFEYIATGKLAVTDGNSTKNIDLNQPITEVLAKLEKLKRPKVVQVEITERHKDVDTRNYFVFNNKFDCLASYNMGVASSKKEPVTFLIEKDLEFTYCTQVLGSLYKAFRSEISRLNYTKGTHSILNTGVNNE